MKFKKILITGGAGFIGGNLIRNILQHTNSVVYNLDKLSHASNLESIEELNVDKKRHFHFKIDLNDKKRVEKAIF